MNNVITGFLDTVYDKPIHSFKRSKSEFEVYCGDDIILKCYLHNSKDLTYSTWTVSYDLFFKIYNFIPVSDDEIEGAIVSWVKMKFKSQGTSFDNEFNRFKHN